MFSKRSKKTGQWVTVNDETPLQSRNKDTGEKKVLAVLSPFDTDGRAIHIQIVDESMVVLHGEDFLKVAGGAVIIKEEDFLLFNKKTKAIMVFLYSPNAEKKAVEAPLRQQPLAKAKPLVPPPKQEEQQDALVDEDPVDGENETDFTLGSDIFR